ncbi:MAG: DUF2855 family protein [Actinomycetota bacterium]
MATRLIVPKNDLTKIAADRVDAPVELGDGQLRVAIDRFGLTTNNITYALFGNAMGYWSYFPVGEGSGCVPVWGFGDVVESAHDDLPAGTRLFGYFPMATDLVIEATAVNALALADGSPHRVGLHPWYNRYYRCSADPVWSADDEDMQAVMWALFMTGWALAEQLAASVRSVVVSSASSKTALSLAWSLRHSDAPITAVGVTSVGNRSFVEWSDVYDHVTTYDELDLDGVDGPAAYVDAAGSPNVSERIHFALGDRLVDSVMLGATHQGAGAATGDAVGPTPRLFFIPDVAEERAAAEGPDAYHAAFAAAWGQFTPWLRPRLAIEHGVGVDAIIEAYRSLLAGNDGPQAARVLSW